MILSKLFERGLVERPPGVERFYALTDNGMRVALACAKEHHKDGGIAPRTEKPRPVCITVCRVAHEGGDGHSSRADAPVSMEAAADSEVEKVAEAPAPQAQDAA